MSPWVLRTTSSSAASAAAFRKRGGFVDLEVSIARERLHRLHAAQVRARVDRGDVEWLEDVDQLLGVLDAFLAHRTEAVVALPVTATAGLGVADEVKRGHPYWPGMGIHLRRRLRSREFHTFGHSLRAFCAARCSIAISCPAALRSRRHGPVASGGSVNDAGWSASSVVLGACAASTSDSSRST